jgi:hypothetical protein
MSRCRSRPAPRVRSFEGIAQSRYGVRVFKKRVLVCVISLKKVHIEKFPKKYETHVEQLEPRGDGAGAHTTSRVVGAV